MKKTIQQIQQIIKLPRPSGLTFFVSNKEMIPTSTSLVPHRPLGYHWSCESKELELESTRFSELDTQREQLEALIQ